MATLGAYVAIHNNSAIPLVSYEGFSIPAGFASDVGIRRVYSDKIGGNYGDCREDVSTILSTDNDYYTATLSLNQYTRKLCYEVCLQINFIMPTCNCSDPSVPITDIFLLKSFCKSPSDLKCVDEVRKHFDSFSLSGNCSAYCPRECNSVKYLTSFSTANYPSVPYYNQISENTLVTNKYSSHGKVISSDVFGKSVLMLNVFYEDLGYTAITEDAAYTFDTVLGIIGD